MGIVEMNGFANNNSHLFRSQLPGSNAGDEKFSLILHFIFVTDCTDNTDENGFELRIEY